MSRIGLDIYPFLIEDKLYIDYFNFVDEYKELIINSNLINGYMLYGLNYKPYLFTRFIITMEDEETFNINNKYCKIIDIKKDLFDLPYYNIEYNNKEVIVGFDIYSLFVKLLKLCLEFILVDESDYKDYYLYNPLSKKDIFTYSIFVQKHINPYEIICRELNNDYILKFNLIHKCMDISYDIIDGRYGNIKNNFFHNKNKNCYVMDYLDRYKLIINNLGDIRAVRFNNLLRLKNEKESDYE